MLRNICLVVTFFAFAMVIAAPAVQAQSHVAANVPFTFIMNDHVLSAGHYEVMSRSAQVAILRNTQTGVGSFLIKSQQVESRYPKGAELVFNRYGDVYFLSQIWDGQSDIGIQLAPGKREKEMQLADSRFRSGPEVVIIAMK
jgi:hypothetical protein